MIKRKYSPCSHRIVKASKNKLSLDEADDILKNIKDAQEKLERKGYTASDAVSEAVKKHFDDAEYYRQKEKLNGLRNIKIKVETTARIQEFIDTGLNVHDSEFAFMHGTNSDVAGTRDSIDLKIDKVTASYAGRFISTLEKENLLNIFKSEQFTKEIVNDLWELSYGRKPISKTPQINRIAEFVYNLQNDMRKRLNKAGADIKELQGFIVSQSHDIDTMTRKGKKQWVAFVKDRLDMERSFGGTVDNESIDEALTSAYEALVTNVRHSNVSPDDNVKLFQFSGISNKAKKLSQSRQIVFKTADDFLQYQDAFGRNTFNEAVVQSIRSGSKDIALLENLGTNPRAMLEAVFKEIRLKNRDKLSKQNQSSNLVKDGIDVLLGGTEPISNRKWIDITNSIKNFNILTFLGRSVFTQIPDLQFKASEYQHQGRSFLSSWQAVFNDLKQGLKSEAEKKEFASLVGVYAENMLADLNVKISTGKTIHKKISRLTQLFMKLNLQEPWDKANKTSMSRTMAHDLGLKSHKSFSELDEDTQRIFSLYNITEEDWDIIRANKRTLEDGRDYVVAEGIEDVKLAEKLQGYFIDRVNYATNAITGSTKARMAFGGKRGTVLGELNALILQFKSFMFSMIEKSFGREIYGKKRGVESITGSIVQMILGITALAYVGMTIKDILSNKTPKDPTDPKVFMESMIKGGGLGIAGDLLYVDNSSTFKKDLGNVVFGPTYSRGKDIHDLYQSLMLGQDAKAEALRVGTSYVPFNNLFYVREPLNELMLYSIQEHLNPGYLKRIDARNKERYDQNQIIETR